MSTDLIDFLNIKNKFVKFLNDKICCPYKYRQHYISSINESIETLIEEQLINYILFIQKEVTTCRGHNTGDILKKQCEIEVEIITESQKLLKKFKTSIINDINIILKLEKNVNYKNKIYHFVEYSINFQPITDISFTDLYPIIQNLQAINILRYINNKTVDDNLRFIIRYLMCFNYKSLD